MASSSTCASHYFSFLFVLFCISTTCSSAHISASDIDGVAVINAEKITKALSDAGYEAMSLTLQLTIPTLLNSITTHNNTTTTTTASGVGITIFCPPDQVFFSLKYPQPPLTLLQYHVVPMKLERETLLESHQIGSKIDTLLQGHPLVVTRLPRDDDSGRKASINGVEINKWDVYNDGDVIVHGVDEFFDPSYQTILYPQYDHTNNSSTGYARRYSSSDDVENGGDDVELVLEYVLVGVMATIVGLILCALLGVAATVAGLIICAVLGFIGFIVYALYSYGFAGLCNRLRSRHRADDGYVPLE